MTSTITTSSKTKDNVIKFLHRYQNFIIVLGLTISFIGGSWDITFHILNEPESFFSYPHTLVYSGIFLVIFSFYFNIKKNFLNDKSLKINNIIILVGTVFILAAGPFDFSWHQEFGLDGLLSPPHTVLLSGWLIVGWGNLRILFKRYESIFDSRNPQSLETKDLDQIELGKKGEENDVLTQSQKKEKIFVENIKEGEKKSKNIKTSYNDLYKIFNQIHLLLNLSFILLIASGFVYFFSLPFSETQFNNFNPDPLIGLLIYSLGFPILISFYFLQILYKFQNKFGNISIVATLYIGVMLITQIVSNPYISGQASLLYTLNIIPFLIIDIFNNKLKKQNSTLKRDHFNFQYLFSKQWIRNRYFIYGIVFGFTTYSLCFPLNIYVLNELLIGYLISQDMVIDVYRELFFGFYPIVGITSFLGGFVGYLLHIMVIRRNTNIFTFNFRSSKKQEIAK